MVQFQLSHLSLWRLPSAEQSRAGNMTLHEQGMLQCLITTVMLHQARREAQELERRAESNGFLDLH